MSLQRFLSDDRFMITKLAVVWCTLTFFGGELLRMQDRSFDFGAFTLYQLWNLELWRLASANFLHGSLLHYLFNMYWLVFFGVRVESFMRAHHYLLFLSGAALCTAGLHVTVDQSSAVGMSGVVYALFGFIVVLRRERDDLRNEIASYQLNILWLWLGAGFLIGGIGGARIANWGHVGGLLYGLGIAPLFSRELGRIARYGGFFAANLLMIGCVLYSAYPVRNPVWRAWRAGDIVIDMDELDQRLQRLEFQAGYQVDPHYALLVLSYEAYADNDNDKALNHLRQIPPESPMYPHSLHMQINIYDELGRTDDYDRTLSELSDYARDHQEWKEWVDYYSRPKTPAHGVE